MIIEVQPWRIGTTVVSYKVRDFKPCCDVHNIDGLARLAMDVDDNPFLTTAGDKEFGVFVGNDDDGNYKIKYCPLCGEKIVIKTLPSLDMAELLNDMTIKLAETRVERDEATRRVDGLNGKIIKLKAAIESVMDTDPFPPDETNVFWERRVGDARRLETMGPKWSDGENEDENKY